MLMSVLRHWLRIQLKKILTSLLWEMKKTVKILINFFLFSLKIYLIKFLTNIIKAIDSIFLKNYTTSRGVSS